MFEKVGQVRLLGQDLCQDLWLFLGTGSFPMIGWKDEIAVLGGRERFAAGKFNDP
jgi:hypothetical protein